MKKITPLILIAIALSLILVGLWYYSDKRVILRKTDTLLKCFKKTEDDGVLTGVLSENKFRDLLDKQVKIDFRQKDMPDIQDGIPRKRDDLAKLYLYLTKSARSISLTDKSTQIKSIEDDTALVTTDLHAEIQHRDYSLNKDLSIKLHFRKTGEGWRISQVTME